MSVICFPLSTLICESEQHFVQPMLASLLSSKPSVVVRVQEGNSLTGLVLPVIAIFISLVAAGLTFWQWYLEGRRVVVDGQSASLVTESEHRPGLMVSATNNGRISAIIRQWGFDNPREVYSATPGNGVWSLGPSMPHTLDAGTSQVWWLDSREQKALLEARHPGGPYLLRGFVVLGTRRRKVSRSYINMSTRVTVPANRIWRAAHRIRSRRGIAIMIFGRLGSANFDLQCASAAIRELWGDSEDVRW